MARNTKPVAQVEEKNEVVTEPVKAPKPKKTQKTGKVVKCTLLNIRKEASMSSEVVGTLAVDSVIDILGEERGFFKVPNGFVMKEYIELR